MDVLSNVQVQGEDGTNLCPAWALGLPLKNSMNVARTRETGQWAACPALLCGLVVRIGEEDGGVAVIRVLEDRKQASQ